MRRGFWWGLGWWEQERKRSRFGQRECGLGRLFLLIQNRGSAHFFLNVPMVFLLFD